MLEVPPTLAYLLFAWIVLRSLPCFGHALLGLLRDFDEYRSSRARPDSGLSRFRD